jgi:squalene-hopene/tetraprenyl-beta-curcumene cyclase
MEAVKKLISELNPEGYWRGELSSSALSTATATFAIYLKDKKRSKETILKALEWLANNANSDGGWGDSPDSSSNLSTTILAWSALSISEDMGENYTDVNKNAEKWIIQYIRNKNKNPEDSLTPANIANAVLNFYGDDKTFSAPILMMCAAAGRLGDNGWKYVPQLPFELSILPHSFFRIIKLPVVSYAMPALIAIGIAKHANRGDSLSPLSGLRQISRKKSLKILAELQPEHGGFLEATPLTSFVLMGLTSANIADSPVSDNCLDFILNSVRDDGAWPIDTNLATWLTALSVKALDIKDLSKDQQDSIRLWLLNQQFTVKHPFTKAAPGGWGWTNLPGSTPDADDTSAVLIALHKLDNGTHQIKTAVRNALQWLLDLQNSDGGIPTFCKGWGKLPFDRSCPDITAHTLYALTLWRSSQNEKLQKKIDYASSKCLKYLKDSQKSNGAWIPLWFGNQLREDKENPVYGTSQVIIALAEYLKTDKKNEQENVSGLFESGCRYLRSSQISQLSTEELSLAVTALSYSDHPDDTKFVNKGKDILKKLNKFSPSPIGLYFASLWYSEKLYPVIFTAMALTNNSKTS